jgi:hypothetical protein
MPWSHIGLDALSHPMAFGVSGNPVSERRVVGEKIVKTNVMNRRREVTGEAGQLPVAR